MPHEPGLRGLTRVRQPLNMRRPLAWAEDYEDLTCLSSPRVVSGVTIVPCGGGPATESMPTTRQSTRSSSHRASLPKKLLQPCDVLLE
jgi:hypothetical protein